MLPPLPMHGGDRNRTSPFAFTGNKFEFRAARVEHVARVPEHGPQHDRRRGDRRPRRQGREAKVDGRRELDDAVTRGRQGLLRAPTRQIVFGGDNYDEAWHAEAEKRGLKNLRTTPDALPEVLAAQTIEAFGNYDVLSERELESRYEVWLEQYIINANIEAETADGDRPRR